MALKRSSLADFFIISGLLLVQAVFGFYTVFLNRILALGFNPLFMIAAGSFVGAIFLAPFALAVERSKWPARITPIMMAQFCLLAFGGVTVFQGLLLMGIKRTTPAIASAMPNLIPGFVFIFAAILRFEKFSIRCKYSQAKVLGLVVCLGGAIAMSLLQTPSVPKLLFYLGNSAEENSYKDWIWGFSYLLAAVIIVSFIMVLQATTLISFPAPFSLCVITSLMGSIMTGILQILVEGKFYSGSPKSSSSFIIVVVGVGSVISSICVVYQTWCMSKKGPLLVSIFSPIQTLAATSLSMILFGQTISIGSSIGVLFMIKGLYVVLWAKNRENFEPVEETKGIPQSPIDIEKPLLS